MTEGQEVDETNRLSSTTIRSISKNQSSKTSSSKTTDCNRVSTFSQRRDKNQVWILIRLLSTSRSVSI